MFQEGEVVVAAFTRQQIQAVIEVFETARDCDGPLEPVEQQAFALLRQMASSPPVDQDFKKEPQSD